jgi:hypothetical protein
MDIISSTHNKQIIEGRDVDLAASLRKDYESAQADSSLHTSSGLEINLPGKIPVVVLQQTSLPD